MNHIHFHFANLNLCKQPRCYGEAAMVSLLKKHSILFQPLVLFQVKVTGNICHRTYVSAVYRSSASCIYIPPEYTHAVSHNTPCPTPYFPGY